MTNTGKTPLSVPIGDDPVPLLAPTEKDRRAFAFDVQLREGRSTRHIGTARSACNSAHKECNVVLQPEDTILFWLPAGTWQEITHPPSADDFDQRVSVSVSSTRMITEGGENITEYPGEPVNSENQLPMPHIAKVQMIGR